MFVFGGFALGMHTQGTPTTMCWPRRNYDVSVITDDCFGENTDDH